MRRSIGVTAALVVALGGGALPAFGATRSAGLLNLAVGQVATQSSSASYVSGAPAERAVDGTTDGDFTRGSGFVVCIVMP